MKWTCIIFFTCVLTSHEISPIAWSKGEPIWQEGEPLPQDGQSWIVICARTWNVFDNNSMKDLTFRSLKSIAGHAWIECLNSDGMLSSISTENDKEMNWTVKTDCEKYKFDIDTIRLAFLVPNSLATEIVSSAKTFAEMGYNLFSHNCVHTSNCSTDLAGLNELFEKAFFSWDETGPSYEKSKIIAPGHLYRSLEGKINELTGWDHPYLNPPKELRDQVIWVNLASDDPYSPSFFHPPASLQLEKDYALAMFPTRGNFGGIALSKSAELCLKLDEIYGAVFDEKTYQIILVGKKRIRLPDFKLDDLAVAVQSVYGLKGNGYADPGVTIDPMPGDLHQVRFLGETRNTAFGKALFDADYTLKMLAMGHYPCQVSGYASFCERLLFKTISFQNGCNWRVWITPEKISLVETSDGSGMIFQETKMQCFAETHCSNDPNVQAALENFAAHFTSNYDAISKEYPVFSEIKRLGQITGVVKWLKDHQIPFDPSFFAMYKPTFVQTPESVMKVVSQIPSSNVTLSGGILLELAQNNYSVEKGGDVDSFKEKVIAARPDESSLSWECEDLTAQAVSFVKTQKTGDLRIAFVDLKIPMGEESDLFLTRYYDSFSDHDVGFGRGWSITPFEILSASVGAPFCVVREGNEHWIYQRITDNWFRREDGNQSLFLDNNLNGTLRLDHGRIASFNSLGQLILEQQGTSIFYSYTDGILSEIQHPNGNIRLISKEGRIVQALSSNGKNLTYLYNDRKLLSSVDDKIYYEYDSDLRLSTVKRPSGKVLFSGSYDDYNRLSSCRWALPN